MKKLVFKVLDYSRDLLQKLSGPVLKVRNWPENQFILLVAVIIGLLGGFGAVGFRWLIRVFQMMFFGQGQNVLDLALGLPWWQRILIPTVGGILLAPFIKYFSKETKGHGVPEVMESLALRAGRIRPRTVLTRAVASAISISSGGSVGREGPIVQIGSAMGSTVGQFLRASEARMKTLVACGAAAGMAATFNAPVGGALFAVEVILGDFGLAQVTPIIISSVTATAASRYFLGNYPAFEVYPYHLVTHWELLFYAVLGLGTGLLTWLYVTVLYRSEDLFEKIPIPSWVKPAIGGVIVGTAAVWFPQIYGVGYDAINISLRSEMTLILLFCLIFVKLLATSITIGSGGSGGVFAPSLFQGAMLGGALGAIFNHYFPQLTAPYGAYALVGLGAMVAGTIQAPIAAILIIFELTNDYTIILPMMTSCIISVLLANKLLHGESIYTKKLIRKGINLFRGRDLNILRTLKVKEIMVPEMAKVPEDMPLSELIRKALTSRHTSFFQVDDKGRLTGLIPLQNVLDTMLDENLREILVAQDVSLFDYPVLSPEDHLDEVLRRLGHAGIEEAPVVDPRQPEIPIGVLHYNDVMQAYRNAIIRQDLGTHVSNGLTGDQTPVQVELLSGYRMVEIAAPRSFVGRTISELGISKKYGVQVFLIRKGGGKTQSEEGPGPEEMHFVPKGTDRIDQGDRLVIVGTADKLNSIIKMS